MAQTEHFSVTGFRPVCLTVDKIGPFQDKIHTFDFTDKNNDPCDFYLFVSPNGGGKTTLLELMADMMRMLGRDSLGEFGIEALDAGDGRAQLDILLQVEENGVGQTVIFSIVAGNMNEDESLKNWFDDELNRLGAEAWHRFGFVKLPPDSKPLPEFFDKITAINGVSLFIPDFINHLHRQIGTRPQESQRTDFTWPALLYFPASRDIKKTNEAERAIKEPSGWGYQTAKRFGGAGRQWTDSPDNLLVWLKWLDDGRLERAMEIVNDMLFREGEKKLTRVRKDPPEAIIESAGNQHRLDQLSSGEKSLLQICLRVAAHMTKNSILLIDEMDVHLHSKWRHRLLNWLKDMARTYPGLTIIATTHSREVMNSFAFDIEEEGLKKGGFFIEPEK